jgi:hypothetical protein
MPIQLVTGVPGAGKTLFTVSEVLTEFLKQSIEYRGQTVPRRLVIGGVPDLLLPHELMDVPVFDPEGFKDEYSNVKREPGSDPVLWLGPGGKPVSDLEGLDVAELTPIPCRADNWWLWCQPGDVIVVDECQRLFRPMAFGRKIPRAIEMLETHRHYGVDFVLITQHPQLLHKNVRELIGKHQHVRRVYGGSSTIVYEWDHCTHPDRTKNATTRFWKHKKAAFGLYKSAEVHTKQKQAIPFAVFAFVLAVVALVPFGFYLKHRLTPPAASELAASSPSGLPASASEPAPVARALVVSDMSPGMPRFQRDEWPDEIAGCYMHGDECLCIRQHPGPRFVRGRDAFCRAVVAGDYRPPASHAPADPASAPGAFGAAAGGASAPGLPVALAGPAAAVGGPQ